VIGDFRLFENKLQNNLSLFIKIAEEKLLSFNAHSVTFRIASPLLIVG
jgi:hypothetical protein